MFERTLNLRRSSRFCFSTFLSAISTSAAKATPTARPTRPWHTGEGEPKVRPTLFRAGAGDGLAGLDLHVFAFVANAFAFVGLGLAHAADVAGELADKLLVGAAHVNLVALDFDHQALRQRQ